MGVFYVFFTFLKPYTPHVTPLRFNVLHQRVQRYILSLRPGSETKFFGHFLRFLSVFRDFEPLNPPCCPPPMSDLDVSERGDTIPGANERERCRGCKVTPQKFWPESQIVVPWQLSGHFRPKCGRFRPHHYYPNEFAYETWHAGPPKH